MIEEKTTAAKEIDAAKAQQQATKSGKSVMHIKVYSPFRNYFEDDAVSISGQNATGPFDILPHHHNFISLLVPCELVIRGVTSTPDHEQRIRISGGLIHVKADQVVVFLDV